MDPDRFLPDVWIEIYDLAANSHPNLLTFSLTASSVPKTRVVLWFAHGLKIMNQGLICLGFHPPAQGAFCEPGFEPGAVKMKTGTLLTVVWSAVAQALL